MTHTKRCYFNVLLYLTSPLLTEFESTTVSLTTAAIRTVRTGTAGLSFILGLGRWWWEASRSGCFTPCTYWTEDYVACTDAGRSDKMRNLLAVSRWPVPDTNCNVLPLNKNASNFIPGEME